MKMMTFHLAGETYAVDLGSLVAVVRGAEEPEGGQRPLVELAALLGVAERPGRNAPVVVLRRGDGREAGVRVERLGEVVEVDEAALSRVPHYFDAPLLQGVVRVGERLAILLDPAVLIDEALALTAAAEAAAGARERS